MSPRVCTLHLEYSLLFLFLAQQLDTAPLMSLCGDTRAVLGRTEGSKQADDVNESTAAVHSHARHRLEKKTTSVRYAQGVDEDGK